ncbi:MAG: flagellar biosynthesis anti-sigma factor FlgM [Syntrophorhabdaceae bacterium]
MKIENGSKPDLLENLVKATQVKPQKDVSVDQKKAEETGCDKVEISSRKQEIDSLAARAKARPAVREEKVERLKQAIEEGTYNAKGEIVAGSILKANILDELL